MFLNLFRYDSVTFALIGITGGALCISMAIYIAIIFHIICVDGIRSSTRYLIIQLQVKWACSLIYTSTAVSLYIFSKHNYIWSFSSTISDNYTTIPKSSNNRTRIHGFSLPSMVHQTRNDIRKSLHKPYRYSILYICGVLFVETTRPRLHTYGGGKGK